ncbi:flagellar motor protein MotB [Falsihalocynthiibacter sp. S25ZX9]|uniref:flagellar motor protein MotB n=1 Tax=unclassified Falsihalocynthiibacter TaxID=2854191 RepID=UPI00350EBBE0
MSVVDNSKRPIIIKRKKIIAAGHHGGAWKVAYADFVTAMMAFFLLMWLLGATNEKQRKAIADYFNPTITINRNSGGGGSFFGGDSPFPEETLAHNGVGASNPLPEELLEQTGKTDGANGGLESEEESAARAAEEADLEQAQQILLGAGGESILLDQALTHVLTRLTDEGLVIEVFDIPGEPLFIEGTSQPTEITREIAEMMVRVFKLVRNEVAVNGHTQAVPIVALTDSTWSISTARAMAMRQLLEQEGLEGKRVQRVTGFASRKTIDPDPMSYRNNRLELILLRSDF